jgi:phosphoribosylformylglycinamidine synthase
MAEACRALDFPVVSGNVSLYNETKADDGSSLAILPTPAIGGVGLLDDWERSATIGFKAEREHIVVVGDPNISDLGQSLWMQEINGRRVGPPPKVNLQAERRAGEFVRFAIRGGLVSAVHDVSDGGMLVAIAEMALASGIGAMVTVLEPSGETVAVWFGEGQGRYIVATSNWDGLYAAAKAAGVGINSVGETGGDTLKWHIDEQLKEYDWSIPLADLRVAHEGFFPNLMGGELTPEF